MRNSIMLTIATLSAAMNIQADQIKPIEISVGGAIKSMSSVATAPNMTNLSIVTEGAGRIVLENKSIRFHILCNIVDTVEREQITAGIGSCELTSVAGGKSYASFQTLYGVGDKGHLTLRGGSGEFTGISVSIPIAVTVNPPSVGKPVFFLETRNPESDKEH